MKHVFRLPKTWRWVTIDDIGIVINGGTPSTKEPEFWGNEVAWITPADLSNYNDIYISRGRRNITKVGLEYSSAKLLPKNSILFSSRAPIGYVAIAKNELSTNQGFKNLVLSESINPKYVYYYLKTIRELAENLASGTTFLELSTTKFKKIPFPLAPIEEQNRIVEKIEESLEELHSAENSIKKALIKADVYLKKVINDAFKDKTNKKSPRREWISLNDIGEIVGGGTPSTKTSSFWGDDISWITPSDLSNYDEKYISRGSRSITHEGLKKSSAKILPQGSVLFSTRAPIGYVVIAKNELATNQGFKNIIPNEKINSSYLFYYLKSIKTLANNLASGTTFLELSTVKFKRIPFPLTPLKIQNRIVEEIEYAESHKKTLEKILEDCLVKCDYLKSKILEKAFKGSLSNSVSTDSSIEAVLDDIENHKSNYIQKQAELNKVRSKIKREEINLLEKIQLQFGTTPFSYLELSSNLKISNEKLKNEFSVLLKSNSITKFFDKETGIVKYKL